MYVSFTLQSNLRIENSTAINVEEEPVPWAAAGSNATIYLTAVDPIHVGIGSVLCPPADIIPVATVFTARIIVFDVIVPITAGASVSRLALSVSYH